MASFFGEVIHPSSRAFWNDDGDDDETLDYNRDNLDFVINWMVTEPSQFKKLIIVEGQTIVDFVSTCLLKEAKNVCNISSESDKNSSNIYEINGFYICTITTKLNITETGELLKALGPMLLKAQELYAITSDHMSNYKHSEAVESVSFIKTLYSCTARKAKSPQESILKQPNIITGLCSGALAFAEISDLYCIMYILYTDTFSLDSKSAVPLRELFSKLLEKPVPNFINSNSIFFNKGNLYM